MDTKEALRGRYGSTGGGQVIYITPADIAAGRTLAVLAGWTADELATWPRRPGGMTAGLPTAVLTRPPRPAPVRTVAPVAGLAADAEAWAALCSTPERGARSLGIPIAWASEPEFAQLAAAGGLSLEGGRITGLSVQHGDGSFAIHLVDRLAGDPAETRRVLAHELGHCRAIALHGDYSEAAADAWATAFDQAAPYRPPTPALSPAWW